MRTLPAALLGAALLAAAPADAQRRDRPFAERGDVALVAEVGNLLSLDLAPLRGGVGVRYRSADRTVLGASLGGGVTAFDVDRSSGRGSEDGGGDDEVATFAATVWAEQHLGRPGPVSPFVGVGLQTQVRSFQRTFESVVQRCDESGCGLVSRTSESELDGLSVGAAAFVGAEVRLARRVTLGAAYSLGVDYATDETRNEEREGEVVWQSERSERRGVSVGTGLSRVALSVYL